ncbi:SDR family NAD(P)-dependent oxidoreductase [Candidatus Cyrtobacter comes]|uniref:SDR family NAD(P)-dependent oxidoreductase n=1 Tax=Candidatus Cyrtobacter comes TaxID=675776 RepID=UPI002ACD7D2E|nr:SDR family NAD(P)-dependent oxidoreductase [Candidatus Cyrtobacter comes]
MTGASSKLGRVLSLSLAKSGYDMLLHYNSSLKVIEDLIRKIEEVGKKADLFQMDFLQISNGLSEDFLDFISGAEVIINNASLFERDTFSSFDANSYTKHTTINALIPTLIVQGASSKITLKNVINILDSTLNNESFFSYSASKVLFEYLTKVMAKELAPKVRVNGLSLGYVLLDEGDVPDKLVQKNTLMRQAIHYEQVLSTVHFILQNESIAGSIIQLDGGAKYHQYT